MKKLTFILTCITLFKVASGQDTLRRFEFGSTILTVNSFNSNSYLPDDRAPVELLNGLFFRYTKKRFGLRIQASYSEHALVDTYAADSLLAGSVSREMKSKDFRFGLGGQFSILKHKEWLYTCLDITYRYVYSSGHSYSLIPYQFTSRSNGADCFLGIGFKLKIIRNFILSPEIGYNGSFQFTNRVSTFTAPYLLNKPDKPDKVSNSDINVSPVFKLRLSVKF